MFRPDARRGRGERTGKGGDRPHDTVSDRRGGGKQVRTGRGQEFSPRKQQRFFDGLALTCNVTRAAEYAGVHVSTPYRHRASDPLFASRFREALALGYDRLEALVLEHGGAGQPIEPADPERASAEAMPAAPFDLDAALRILAHYRRERAGEPTRRTGRPPVNASPEETNAALIKALAAAGRRLAKAMASGTDGD